MPKKELFTAEEIAQIKEAAHRTFQIIGNDLMAATAEGVGRDYMTQDEVIETVIDADQLVTHGRLPRELNERIYKAETRYVNRLFRSIFPAKRYS